MNQRRGLATAVAAAGSNSSIIRGAGYSASSSVTSISQLLLSMEGGMGGGMQRSLPQPPRYSSLPLGQQPPLLPLPTVSKSASLLSPAPTSASRPRQSQKKNRASGGGGSRKEYSRAPVRKLPAAVAVDGGDDEEQLLGMSLYSISPPPSSLPFPRFMLTKPKKVGAVSCNVEAAGGSGGGGGAGVEAGASDDLRFSK